MIGQRRLTVPVCTGYGVGRTGEGEVADVSLAVTVYQAVNTVERCDLY